MDDRPVEKSNYVHFAQVWIRRSCKKPGWTPTNPKSMEMQAEMAVGGCTFKTLCNKFCETIGSNTNSAHSNERP